MDISPSLGTISLFRAESFERRHSIKQQQGSPVCIGPQALTQLHLGTPVKWEYFRSFRSAAFFSFYGAMRALGLSMIWMRPSYCIIPLHTFSLPVWNLQRADYQCGHRRESVHEHKWVAIFPPGKAPVKQECQSYTANNKYILFIKIH